MSVLFLGWCVGSCLYRRICAAITCRSWDGTRTSYKDGPGILAELFTLIWINLDTEQLGSCTNEIDITVT